LGSEIWDLEKTYFGSRISDPGVKKAPDPGSSTLVLYCRKKTSRSKVVSFDVYSSVFSAGNTCCEHCRLRTRLSRRIRKLLTSTGRKRLRLGEWDYLMRTLAVERLGSSSRIGC
jgi:hypothetical protein